jgi:hypothetical protein
MKDDTMNRETWLNELAALMAPRFTELGFPLPKFHVAIGVPSSGKDGNAAAECWNANCSADGAYQIYIRPDEADAMMVAGHLAHELTHAAVGFEHGHKGAFAKTVLALGLQRPLTSTVPGEAFKAYAQPLIDSLAALPHAKLSWYGSKRAPLDPAKLVGEDGQEAPQRGGSSNAKPKQTTRMLKAACTAMTNKRLPDDGSGSIRMGEEPCGYTVRLSGKWARKLGACCPVHGAMEVPGADEGSDADEE